MGRCHKCDKELDGDPMRCPGCGQESPLYSPRARMVYAAVEGLIVLAILVWLFNF